MSATQEGGRKAAQTNKKRYGEDYYKKLGKLGGTTPKKHGGGFAVMDPEKHKAASSKGGSKSRRPRTTAWVEIAQVEVEHKSWLKRIFGGKDE